MNALTKADHFDKNRAPKRVLSLDGGGIRGYLSLQYLTAIEQLLRDRSRNTDFRLCDYFDLIGGTSTGAILAAGLAIGMSAAELGQLYAELGPKVFSASRLRLPFLAPKFPDAPLRAFLDQRFGPTTTLDSAQIRTGLMIMTKRLDTGSPWPLHNHPGARYAAGDGALTLCEVVRASCAAPTYFDPEAIDIHSRAGAVTQGAFVDGGVTPFNDPALQLLMLTALEGHGFGWQQGADKLLLVSIGTGSLQPVLPAEKILRMPAAAQGVRALQALMDDCARVNHTMLQWLTHCLTPWPVDRAVQDMRQDSQHGPKLATYVRYDVRLEPEWLQRELGLSYTADALEKIAAMDDFRNLEQLGEIGRRAADVQIRPTHFPPAFDV